MSQYVLEKDAHKWVYGWDNPLQSFYLQVHVPDVEPDENPQVWLGATKDTRMYEIQELVAAAKRHDLDIPFTAQVQLLDDRQRGV
jgi:hypothetical protein